jgi:hypothetical protein
LFLTLLLVVENTPTPATQVCGRMAAAEIVMKYRGALNNRKQSTMIAATIGVSIIYGIATHRGGACCSVRGVGNGC